MDIASGLADLTLADWLGVTATVVAIAFGVLGVIFYFRQKATKTLDYAILSSQSLTSNQAYPGLDIQASWRNPKYVAELQALDTGPDNQTNETAAELNRLADLAAPKRLHHPTVHIVDIRNTGKQAISESEFTDPIRISVPTGRVVDAVLISKSVPGIMPDGAITDDRSEDYLTFRPRLMNPRDRIGLRVLTDDSTEAPTIQCWIIGETRPMRDWAIRRDRRPGRVFRILATVSTAATLGVSVLALRTLSPSYTPYIVVLTVLLLSYVWFTGRYDTDPLERVPAERLLR